MRVLAASAGCWPGLGFLPFPVWVPVVAAGWLAAAAAGAIAVGAAGGVIGLLAEAGVATNDAEIYAESIRRGGSLVSVRVAESDKERLEAILHPSSVDIVATPRHVDRIGMDGVRSQGA